MRKAELKERRALKARLRGLANFLINAGKLNEQAVVLHALNDRLVGTHRIHAATNHLNNAIIAPGESIFHLLLYGTGRIGDSRIFRNNRFAKLFGVYAESEGRATLQIETETKLLLRRIGHIYGNDGDECQYEPFPNVVAECGFLGHSM